MQQSIYIMGTDTNVGKTVVAAVLLELLRSLGYPCGYFKPVASGGKRLGGQLITEDISFIKEATGFTEENKLINPFPYETPVAPHLAGRLEACEVDLAVIKQNFTKLLSKYAPLIVEGCGGLAVPLNSKGLMQTELIKSLNLECLLVTRSGLGTINHTLLTLAYARQLGIKIVGLIFNYYSGSFLEEDNIATLAQMTGLPILGKMPRQEDLVLEGRQSLGKLIREMTGSLDSQKIRGIFGAKEKDEHNSGTTS